ncbi:hypothetical protein KPH14_011728 [Odynerus spinipes]|uniref:Uncharacterized protein n=1 Tax=Odynerus spinipes TaxID=1348599 RepID=A0AAD9RWS4_9HYME|nr:hypothetical protein KPH14_011728 [Odynerus spinipes]
MSTIFNVFNNLNEHKRFLTGEHLKETKITGQVKKVEQYKPKGLSLRSKSDLNIPTNNYSTPLKKDDSNNLFFSKSELPNKQLLQVPKEFTKTESSELNKEKVLEENIFKEPSGLENMYKQVFPEPEDLAPYYDPQLELDDVYNISLENEFSKFMLNIQDDTDEGLGSDLEELSFVEMPTVLLPSGFIDNEYENYGSPELPDISDDDTF